MTPTFNVAEAKAKLSDLVARAERGEEVVIARRGKPVAKLVAVKAVGVKELGSKRVFGAWAHLGVDLPDNLFDPDPEDAEHVRAWLNEKWPLSEPAPLKFASVRENAPPTSSE